MNYITILTPDNIEIEYRLAGPGSRIAALCIDLLLQTITLVLFAFFCYFVFLNGNMATLDSLNNISWLIALILIVLFIVIFGYYIAAEAAANGQTLGKKLLGLRVIRDNGSPVGLIQSLIRNCIKLFVDIFGIGVVMIMFSKSSKRIGDMAAGTVVIACDSRKIVLDPDNVFSEHIVNKAHNINVNNRLIITAKEKRLLKEYFANRYNYTDAGETAEEALITHFSEKFDVPRSNFNPNVLKWMLENN